MSFTELYKSIGSYIPPAIDLRQGRRPDISMIPIVYGYPGTVEELSERYQMSVLYTKGTGEQQVSVVDKVGAHSVTDLMLMATSADKLVITLKDLTQESSYELFRQLYAFVDYTTDTEIINRYSLNGGFFRIGFNIDPATQDRGAIQGERFLHPHCLCFANEKTRKTVHLDIQNNEKTLLAAVDPVLILGPRLMQELVFNSHSPFYTGNIGKCFEIIDFNPKDLLKKGLPVANILRLKDSWETFKDHNMHEVMSELEESMEKAYSYVKKAFSPESEAYHSKVWDRPQIYPVDQIERNINSLEYLSDETKSGLIMLGRSLRPIPPRVMERLKSARTDWSVCNAEKVLALSGLAYTLTFFSLGEIEETRNICGWNDAYMAIQPILRRTSGAAGVGFDSKGNTFMVDRGRDVPYLTDEEKIIRHDFQQGFVRTICETV